jgi:hypothetical protein
MCHWYLGPNKHLCCKYTDIQMPLASAQNKNKLCKEAMQAAKSLSLCNNFTWCRVSTADILEWQSLPASKSVQYHLAFIYKHMTYSKDRAFPEKKSEQNPSQSATPFFPPLLDSHIQACSHPRYSMHHCPNFTPHTHHSAGCAHSASYDTCFKASALRTSVPHPTSTFWDPAQFPG